MFAKIEARDAHETRHDDKKENEKVGDAIGIVGRDGHRDQSCRRGAMGRDLPHEIDEEADGQCQDDAGKDEEIENHVLREDVEDRQNVAQDAEQVRDDALPLIVHLERRDDAQALEQENQEDRSERRQEENRLRERERGGVGCPPKPAHVDSRGLVEKTAAVVQPIEDDRRIGAGEQGMSQDGECLS